jgi:pilus assembly protein CpaB
MRSRAILMLGLAILFGAASIVLVRQWLATQVTPVAAAPVTRTVVVARVALNFADRLTPVNLREEEWPLNIVPAGAFAHVSDIAGTDQNRVVLRPIDQGEVVLASKVSGQGGRATLSTVIDNSMRAYTIRVNEVSGTAGFVLPNDRVDILLTRHPEGAQDPITDVLLQNVKVLAVDQQSSQSQDKPVVARAVTVLVTQEQAQKLTLAADVGSLTLALRNEADAVATTARTIAVKDLRIGEANTPAAAPTAAPAPVVVPRAPRADPFAKVEVTRGIQSQTVEVSREGGGAPGVARAVKSRQPASAVPSTGG